MNYKHALSGLVGRFTLSGGPCGPYALKPVYEGGADKCKSIIKTSLRSGPNRRGETVQLKM